MCAMWCRGCRATASQTREWFRKGPGEDVGHRGPKLSSAGVQMCFLAKAPRSITEIQANRGEEGESHQYGGVRRAEADSGREHNPLNFF